MNAIDLLTSIILEQGIVHSLNSKYNELICSLHIKTLRSVSIKISSD